MAYITPATRVYLLAGVPLDPGHNNSIWFSSASAQESYFTAHAVRRYTDFTYSRAQRGVIKVPAPVEDCYTCNYLMYGNTAYENKWIYAFIDNVEYINDNCTAIHYTIDDLQTWLCDITLPRSYVARAHSATDEIGDNTVAEGFAVGDYVQERPRQLTSTGEDLQQLACIVGVVDADDSKVTYDINAYDNIFSGYDLYAFTSDRLGAAALQEFLDDYKKTPEAIAMMYMVPRPVIDSSALNSGEKIPSNYSTGSVTFSEVVNGTGISGSEIFGVEGNTYTPKNKKLYTYPYNYFAVIGGGESLVLRYEWFPNLMPRLQLDGTLCWPPAVMLRPYQYALTDTSTAIGSIAYSHTESITLADWPQCSCANDTFRTWAAQNAGKILCSAAKDIGQVLVGAVTANPLLVAGGAASTVKDVVDYGKQAYDASRAADVCVGSTSPNTLVACSDYIFYGQRFCADADTARYIDSYFDLYGYAQNRLMDIDPTVRPAWYYVQTAGMSVQGSIPQDSAAAINAIFDSGVRFWHNGDSLGDYSQSNGV